MHPLMTFLLPFSHLLTSFACASQDLPRQTTCTQVLFFKVSFEGSTKINLPSTKSVVMNKAQLMRGWKTRKKCHLLLNIGKWIPVTYSSIYHYGNKNLLRSIPFIFKPWIFQGVVSGAISPPTHFNDAWFSESLYLSVDATFLSGKTQI